MGAEKPFHVVRGTGYVCSAFLDLNTLNDAFEFAVMRVMLVR